MESVKKVRCSTCEFVLNKRRDPTLTKGRFRHENPEKGLGKSRVFEAGRWSGGFILKKENERSPVKNRGGQLVTGHGKHGRSIRENNGPKVAGKIIQLKG